MDITKLPEYDGHELVAPFEDRKSGLRGFIAIHRTTLGPAAGATRYLRYAKPELALRDALRLSRAMTYKCALAGVPYGGGKGVIMANTHARKRTVVRAYAHVVDTLGGAFLTGEDVGMAFDDVRAMARVTPYIIGTSRRWSRPAFWTAAGVFNTMELILARQFDKRLSRSTVAVKGLGKVGLALAEMLGQAGARVVAADIEPRRERLAARTCPGIQFTSPRSIHHEAVDVFAPCALGDELTAKTVRELRAPLVCGGANNQLATPEDGVRLWRTGIIYVPDYLVNSGGLINVVAERRHSGYRESWVRAKVHGIRQTALAVVEASARRRVPTNEVADRMAEKLFTRRPRSRNK